MPVYEVVLVFRCSRPISSEAEHSRRAKGEETQKPHEDHNLSYRFGAHSHGTPCVNA